MGRTIGQGDLQCGARGSKKCPKNSKMEPLGGPRDTLGGVGGPLRGPSRPLGDPWGTLGGPLGDPSLPGGDPILDPILDFSNFFGGHFWGSQAFSGNSEVMGIFFSSNCLEKPPESCPGMVWRPSYEQNLSLTMDILSTFFLPKVDFLIFE